MNTQLIKESILYRWKTSDKLSKLINIFNNRVEIRFVGGCVRDIFLGFPLKEIDFAINCKPKETIMILEESNIDYLDTGLSHGTVTALIDKKKYEITSLRKDIKTYGRFAEVEYTKDWEQDALRRDFCMNAIYLSMNGDLYDKFNGISDIENQKISFIGNTLKRIQEDFLRILRFYRFLGLFKSPKYNQEDLDIVNSNFDKIRKFVSNEKIKKEILKMLLMPFSKNSFILIGDNNIREKNILISNLEKWWSAEKYIQGVDILERCKKKFNVEKY